MVPCNLPPTPASSALGAHVDADGSIVVPADGWQALVVEEASLRSLLEEARTCIAVDELPVSPR